MCRTFYKYFLITSTSFMATAGLYFLCLTRWLWTSPIDEYTSYDWRRIPEELGAISFVIFSIGLIIVLRARTRELLIFGLLLVIPLVSISAILIIQMIGAEIIFNPSHLFLIVVIVFYLAIIVNIFLFVYSLKLEHKKPTCKQLDQFVEIEL